MHNLCLKKISFSENIKKIHPFVFTRCDKLDKVILPEGVEHICSSAFYNFSGTKVVIPKSVKVIEEKAFSYCVKLKKINFLGTKEQWKSIICNRNIFYDTKNPKEYTVNCTDGELFNVYSY